MFAVEQRRTFLKSSLEKQVEIYESIIAKHKNYHNSPENEDVSNATPFADKYRSEEFQWISRYTTLRGFSVQRHESIQSSIEATKCKMERGENPTDPDHIKKLENELRYLVECLKIKDPFDQFRALYEVMAINTPQIVDKSCGAPPFKLRPFQVGEGNVNDMVKIPAVTDPPPFGEKHDEGWKKKLQKDLSHLSGKERKQIKNRNRGLRRLNQRKQMNPYLKNKGQSSV